MQGSGIEPSSTAQLADLIDTTPLRPIMLCERVFKIYNKGSLDFLHIQVKPVLALSIW